MATIINADTSDGLKLTADASGELELQSGGVTQVKITSSGVSNLSIGSPNTELDFEVANTFGTIYITVGDDAVATIPAPKIMGFLSITSNPLSPTPPQNGVMLAVYDCGTSKQIQKVVEAYTGGEGALSSELYYLYRYLDLTGTAGEDDKVSISTHVDGSIQVENRLGETHTFSLTFL